jgi:hypothetical protein
MSFFDEGDEPTRVTRPARPRRPAPAGAATRPGGGGPGGGGPGGVDPQTVRIRQAVALGIGALVIIFLILGVNSCLDSRKERALKDYNRDVTAVITDSDEQVSTPFFQLLGRGGRDAGDLSVQVNQYRLAAEEDVKRAEGFDVPGEMKGAHAALELVLNLRAGALEKIAEKLPTALARGANNQATADAVDQIAGQMQAFLASDVIYSQRVSPLIKQALDDANIGGQTIKTSKFLPAPVWIGGEYVRTRLGAEAGGSQGPNAPVAPGLHGHGLTSVAVGNVTLQPSPAVNRIPAGSGLAFNVKFANQGDNDESSVNVVVRIRGAGQPITVRRTVNRTTKKSPAEVSIQLGQAPPIGQAVTIEAEVRPVRGERKTDNNKQSYTAIFTR